jgi:hypothetical protein
MYGGDAKMFARKKHLEGISTSSFSFSSSACSLFFTTGPVVKNEEAKPKPVFNRDKFEKERLQKRMCLLVCRLIRERLFVMFSLVVCSFVVSFLGGNDYGRREATLDFDPLKPNENTGLYMSGILLLLAAFSSLSLFFVLSTGLLSRFDLNALVMR